MPPKSKSIWRGPNNQHFQLVHRSQRDPLIHDESASKHVLKAIERPNAKGKSLLDLEATLPLDQVEQDRDRNVGEAALYGIYYDDTEYNYMQHLRPVGIEEEGVESILIEAPSSTGPKNKGKGKAPISLKDLPAEVLPSSTELPLDYSSQDAIPASISGLHPDMDPHLRQTLEALEDNAFIDDDLEDDFFGKLVTGGERDEDDEPEYEFEEYGVPEETSEGSSSHEEDTFEARFAKFKREQKSLPSSSDIDSDLDVASEGGDTITQLPQIHVIGGKRRRKGSSEASGYSMSSSSMVRNEALQTLDERFDQFMAKHYGSDEDGFEDDEDEATSQDSDEVPELIASREDFESIMDEFMSKYEVVGRKMNTILEGDSGVDKLNTLRRTMGHDDDRILIENDNGINVAAGEADVWDEYDDDPQKDRWDCETILTTYTNLENHPRLIRAREPRSTSKITLDPKTGLPSVAKAKIPHPTKQVIDTIHGELDLPEPHKTVARPRNESKEDKKARKQQVKEERQVRRASKKSTKEQFSTEIKHQKRNLMSTDAPKMRKL